jgi:hypothetical protein
MKVPLPGPVCEAHSAFPSLLAVSEPMLYRGQCVQSVTAPTFVPVVRQAVGGLCLSDGVARRHRPFEIV